MAFIFSFIIIMSLGYDEAKLSDVMEGYAAEQAGMQAGDVILKMDGYNVHFYKEIGLYSTIHYGEPVEVTYLRDGEKNTTTLVPVYDEDSQRYLYGFIGTGQYTKADVGTALLYSAYEVKYWIYSTVESLKLLFTGRFGVNDLSGPVGIVQNIGQTYDESVSNSGYYYAFLNMLNWGILLSANLGVMNLLPLPALDGGRLVFLIVEVIRRKKIDPEKEGYVHLAGIILLFLLMFVVMFNDIKKIFI